MRPSQAGRSFTTHTALGPFEPDLGPLALGTPPLVTRLLPNVTLRCDKQESYQAGRKSRHEPTMSHFFRRSAGFASSSSSLPPQHVTHSFSTDSEDAPC